MKYLEYEIQCAAVQWTRYQYPEVIIHSIPNGARVGIKRGYRLKKEGLLAGIPDLFIAEPRGQYHGVYAESKRPKAKPNRLQNLQMCRLRRRGFYVFWYDNLNDYMDEINKYMDFEKHKEV